jgi:hypothetical protein
VRDFSANVADPLKRHEYYLSPGARRRHKSSRVRVKAAKRAAREEAKRRARLEDLLHRLGRPARR